MASVPPPYTSHTSDSEIRIDARAPSNFQVAVEQGDILGLRSQILDNAPTLFLLAHNRHRILPEWLRINTLRIPDNYTSGEATEDAGKIFAVLSSPGGGGREIPTLELCIKGPPADSTEQALRALLDKMERMMGRMWEMATAQGKVVKGKWFLRSIDEQS